MLIQLARYLPHGDSRHRFGICFGVAAVAALLLHGRVSLITQLILTWDIFALSGLGLTWLTIVATPQRALRARARQEDVGRFAIFVFVVIAASTALFAVAFLIR